MRERVERGERHPEGEDDEVALVAHADARAGEGAVVVALEHARATHGAVVGARRAVQTARTARVPRPVGAHVASSALAAVAVYAQLVRCHLDHVHRPAGQLVRVAQPVDRLHAGDGQRVLARLRSFFQVVPVNLIAAAHLHVDARVLARVVGRPEGRLDEANTQPVDGNLEKGDVHDHVMPRERGDAGVGVDDWEHVDDADRRETAHRQPEPHDAHVVQSKGQPESEAGRHPRACKYWMNKTPCFVKTFLLNIVLIEPDLNNIW